MNTDEGKRTFLEIFNKKLGNVKAACEASNISRGTYYKWVENDKEFAENAHNVFEGLKDMAETKLQQAIHAGKTAELIFFLKTKCQDRGYIETIQQAPAIVYNVEVTKDEVRELSKALENEC